jgi:hypothetical protein
VHRYVSQAPIASRYPHALNQCWKSAFSQMHGSVHIWLWLEDKTGRSAEAPGPDGDGDGDRAAIRVVGFGNYFKCPLIIEWMERYCTAVTHVLKEFPGLCHLSQSIVCPTCIMSQHDDDDCGEFSYSELLSQLDAADSSGGPRHGHECCGHDEVRFEDQKAMCKKRQCMIPFELLVSKPLAPKPQTQAQSKTPPETAEVQMQRRLEYLTNEIIRLSAVPSAGCEKAVATVALAFITTQERDFMRSWVPPGRGTGDSAGGDIDISSIDILNTPPFLAPVVLHMASGAFVRIPDTADGTTATVVLSCAHFCINTTTKVFPRQTYAGYHPVFLVGDTENWLYLAEVVTLGSLFCNNGKSGDDLASSQMESKPTQFNCSACLTLNSVDKICCANCGIRKPGEGFWDVSALALTYAIRPAPLGVVGRSIALEPTGYAALTPASPALDVCTELPTREQSLRLMGLSGLSSLSCDWGRVVQIINGLLLVNHVYNEYGASGGPVLDRLGRLVGVLSCVHPDEKAKAFIEPAGKFVKLLQKHTFQHNRHDPQTCNYCQQHPLVKNKFCFNI